LKSPLAWRMQRKKKESAKETKEKMPTIMANKNGCE
jgi:hypothetical protein